MTSVVATLIGDVVGSRDAASRAGLHARLEELVAGANRDLAPVVPLRITVGDEFQGCFADVGSALRAVTRLQAAALPEVDVRFGLGWGEVRVLAEEPRVEDGPGWWAARAAIDAVGELARTAGHRHARVAYRRADGVDGPGEAAVNAALLLRDELLGGLGARSLSVLRGLLEGRTQREVAEDLGISPSAVSQRVRADGLAAFQAAETLLEGVR